MIMHKGFLTALSIFFLFTQCKATFIAIIIYQGVITIGADSKAALNYNQSSVSYNACKIMQTGFTVYSATGTFADFLMKYAKKGLENTGTVLNSFPVTEASKELEKMLFANKDQPYIKKILNQKFANLVYLWYQNSAPRIVVTEFSNSLDKSQHIHVEAKSTVFPIYPPETKFKLTLGDNEAASKFLKSPEVVNNSPIAAIKFLMRIQSEATPLSVGYPLAIAELRNNGLSWIEKGTCK